MKLIIAAVALTLFGLIGHSDQQTKLQETMIDHCEMDAPDCQTLIKSVQSDGKHEVLSKQTGLYVTYWVETTAQARQAIATCGNQGSATTPTFQQCMANQYENNGDN